MSRCVNYPGMLQIVKNTGLSVRTMFLENEILATSMVSYPIMIDSSHVVCNCHYASIADPYIIGKNNEFKNLNVPHILAIQNLFHKFR